jgi:hypothetical protein
MPTYQPGTEVPWVLTKMVPEHLAHNASDFSKIIERLSALREASNAAQ